MYVYIHINLADELSHQDAQGLVESSLCDNDCCAPAHLEASKSARTAVASRTIGINLSCSP